ncbi:MAG: hypothetical protein ABSF46_05090, partial [Terriglobia bacterium]
MVSKTFEVRIVREGQMCPRSVDKFFGQTFQQRRRFLWTKGVRGLGWHGFGRAFLTCRVRNSGIIPACTNSPDVPLPNRRC